MCVRVCVHTCVYCVSLKLLGVRLLVIKIFIRETTLFTESSFWTISCFFNLMVLIIGNKSRKENKSPQGRSFELGIWLPRDSHLGLQGDTSPTCLPTWCIPQVRTLLYMCHFDFSFPFANFCLASCHSQKTSVSLSR